jgi:hypothetical protein
MEFGQDGAHQWQVAGMGGRPAGRNYHRGAARPHRCKRGFDARRDNVVTLA